MLQNVLSLVTTDPRKHKAHGGDSVSDRLSSVLTFYLLIGFAVAIQFGQLAGDPVQCWCPAHFTSSHIDFTNSVCWTSNTYRLANSEEIPRPDEQIEEVSYYQWVGLMLSFQAILFHLPRPIWRSLSTKSGMSVATITDAAMECQTKGSSEEREKTIKYMGNHMGRFLYKLRNNPGVLAMLKGHYIVIVYVFVKILYLVNVVGQLYLLNKFLDTNFNYYGIEILKKMVRQEPWLNSHRFPKVTLCNILIRLLGNVHRYTIQCSLPLNLFNEIIFIFVWFLFVFVAAATAGSLLFHLIFVCIPPIRRSFIKKRLISMGKINSDLTKKEVADIQKFVTFYLKADGCFIIQMVSKNASDLIAAELICELWQKFQETQGTRLMTKRLQLQKAVDKVMQMENTKKEPTSPGKISTPKILRPNCVKADAEAAGYELLPKDQGGAKKDA